MRPIAREVGDGSAQRGRGLISTIALLILVDVRCSSINEQFNRGLLLLSETMLNVSSADEQIDSYVTFSSSLK